MRLMTLRESLQPSIKALTEATDYWSEITMRGKAGGHHYIMLVKTIEQLKTYILEAERADDEELRLSSRSNGRLHKNMDEGMEDSGVEYFGAARDRYARSNS